MHIEEQDNYAILNKFLKKVANGMVIDIDNISVFLEELSNEINFKNHPLFKLLDASNISTQEFGQIMAPFYFAIYNWTVHLTKFSGLLRRNEDFESSEYVEENVFDELGFSGGHVNYNNCHTVTYINFLHSLGFCGRLQLNDAVQDFNNILNDFLIEPENITLRTHACILGGIENCYIHVSRFILDFCTKNNIKQEHYNIHEIIDFKHSMDFYKVAKRQNADASDIIIGSITGYVLIWNVFYDLYKIWTINSLSELDKLAENYAKLC
ncbi:MAG: heme oxygenase [Satyrvirus sp.]|uniref:Heme oxygenase n=1 Tax=Satyrvirus sp. TaxID=2487771 RepID=A0A3G5AJN2_9VIRU|nr:MAG: heme oxygenase [Satyrvirus sp.]